MKIMHWSPPTRRYECCTRTINGHAEPSLAIHWGTFDGLTDESLYEPPARLARSGARPAWARRTFS